MKIDAREMSLIFDGDTEARTVALDRIDLTVKERETLGIMGPSGSGKSSLLYVLAGLKTPNGGAVFYDDQDIALFSEAERNAIRRNRFGFIFQRHYLLAHLTVLENILLPLRNISQKDTERAQDLMSELGIIQYKNKRPGEISVGERQKAAVLRALIHHPQVVFADEPTASLDTVSAMRVMDLIQRDLSGASVVIVTHDYKILKNTDRLVHLRDGKIT